MILVVSAAVLTPLAQREPLPVRRPEGWSSVLSSVLSPAVNSGPPIPVDLPRRLSQKQQVVNVTRMARVRVVVGGLDGAGRWAKVLVLGKHEPSARQRCRRG